MGLFDLFKTAEQRRLERRKLERAARRKADSALLACDERIQKLESEAKSIWNEVVAHLKSGQKMFADRALRKFRWHEMIMDQLQRKKFVFNKYIMQMENAQTDQIFSEALSAINKIMDFDPETTIGIMEDFDDKALDQTEIDRHYGKVYEGEMSKSEMKLTDRIPSIDDMMKQAEAEAAIQINSSGINSAANESNENVTDEIGSGREAIKKAFEESEKK